MTDLDVTIQVAYMRTVLYRMRTEKGSMGNLPYNGRARQIRGTIRHEKMSMRKPHLQRSARHIRVRIPLEKE